MYTEEEQKKINELRLLREREIVEKNEYMVWLKNRKTLDVGDPVSITIDGKTISGRITKVYGNGVYDVNTPYGVITNHDKVTFEIRYRPVQDLTNVVVPEELKTISTHKLLKLLQEHRSGNAEYYEAPTWTKEQIKAELMYRPHVPTKGEKKLFLSRVKKGNRR